MNNKTTVIWAGIILIVLVAFFWFGEGGGAALLVDRQLDIDSALSAEQTNFDFGNIVMGDGKVRTSFMVVNNTTDEIKVDSVVTSCMCTEVFIINGDQRRGPYGMPGHGLVVPRANEVIAPGEEREIEVVFDPAAHGPAGAGFSERHVYLVDDEGGVLTLIITAVVTL